MLCFGAVNPKTFGRKKTYNDTWETDMKDEDSEQKEPREADNNQRGVLIEWG